MVKYISYDKAFFHSGMIQCKSNIKVSSHEVYNNLVRNGVLQENECLPMIVDKGRLCNDGKH